MLYEILTGRIAFAGDTVLDTIAKILEREPDWSALPATTSASIRRLLLRCLTKDPKQRLSDIADVRIEIDAAVDETLPSASMTTAHERTTRADLRTARPDVPGGLVSVIEWASDPRPGERYLTADALRDASEMVPRSSPRHGWLRYGSPLAVQLLVVVVAWLAWEPRWSATPSSGGRGEPTAVAPGPSTPASRPDAPVTARAALGAAKSRNTQPTTSGDTGRSDAFPIIRPNRRWAAQT